MAHGNTEQDRERENCFRVSYESYNTLYMQTAV